MSSPIGDTGVVVSLLLDNGRVALLAIVILLAEVGFFTWRARLSRRHALTIPTLLAGLWMMVALYTSLAGGHPLWIIMFLLMSLAAHIGDLYTRLVLDNRVLDNRDEEGFQRPRMRGSRASRRPSPM
jgi:hypothetical protein